MFDQNEDGVVLGLKVLPNAKAFEIQGFDPWTKELKLKTKAKALKGEANKEILQNLQKIFSCEIKIVSGEKSRNKKVFFKKNKKEIEKIIKLL
jgi:uncharacterized protein (TIGR00251 family)